MKPTVSLNVADTPDGRYSRRVVVSNVSKRSIDRSNIRTCQYIEQRRFACIRIAHERHGTDIAPQTASALGTALIPYIGYRTSKIPCPKSHQTTVSLDLRFTGTSCPYSTTKTLQVRPLPCKSRHQILDLCQFDLQLAFPRTRSAREDVKYQRRPVDYLDL